MTDAQLLRHGLATLIEALGPADTMQFLQSMRSPRDGNAMEHRDDLCNVALEALVAEIDARREVSEP